MVGRSDRVTWLFPVALLSLLFHFARAGQTGRDLSSDVSRPLYHTLSGVEDPESAIIELIEDPESIRNCAGGGDGCKVAAFIVGCIVAGSIVMPILTFLACCGFCCGRTCCKCCCKPCCGEYCGGKYPTKPYGWFKSIPVLLLLLASILILFAFSGLGFRAFSEMKGDYDAVLDAGLEVALVPQYVIDDVSVTIDDVKALGISLFDRINAEFLILDEVKAGSADLNATLEALKREMIGLQLLVEGCDASTGSCDIPLALPGVLPTWANPCSGGAHPVGTGATLSNGNVNPACMDAAGSTAVACPCCTECQDIIADIESVQGALPTPADIDDLNQPVNTSLLSTTLDNALGDWDSVLGDFEEQVEPVRDFVTEAKKAVTSEQVDAIAAGLFLLTWLILIAVIVAMLLSCWRNPMGDMGGWCWWGGFVVTVVYLVLIVCPMFGWMTAIALPMESVCNLLPAQGENSDDLFRLLNATGSAPDEQVKELIDDCVLASDGYMWGAADVTRDSLSDTLKGEFDVSATINSTDLTSTLDISGQTADFNQTEVDSLKPTDYGVVDACPAAIAGLPRCSVYLADMAAYRTDLNARIGRAKQAAANVTVAIGLLSAVAGSSESRIDQIFLDAESAIDEIIDLIWEVGTCERISNAYEGLRVPLCDGVAAGVFGTWGVLFIMAFFLYLLLYLINKGAKIAYARRHPEGNPEDKKKVAPAAQSDVPVGLPVPPAENEANGGQSDKLYPNQESN